MGMDEMEAARIYRATLDETNSASTALLAVAAEAERRGREAAAQAINDLPLDELRRAGMQDDEYHEAMRALFVRAARKVSP